MNKLKLEILKRVKSFWVSLKKFLDKSVKFLSIVWRLLKLIDMIYNFFMGL